MINLKEIINEVVALHLDKTSNHFGRIAKVKQKISTLKKNQYYLEFADGYIEKVECTGSENPFKNTILFYRETQENCSFSDMEKINNSMIYLFMSYQNLGKNLSELNSDYILLFEKPFSPLNPILN